MKKILLIVMLMSLAISVPVQFIVRDTELAPRADVHFLYSPDEFDPATLNVKYTVGAESEEKPSEFEISGTDPVIVQNNFFTLMVQKSGEAIVVYGLNVTRFVPYIYDGTNHLPTQSDIQVFSGSNMVSLVWTPLNDGTYRISRIARIWYDQPWIELETTVSSNSTRTVDLREHIYGVNIGTLALDNITTYTRYGLYNGTPILGRIEPSEGWVVFNDGNDACGIGVNADYWSMSTNLADIDITTHKSVSLTSGVQQKFLSYYQILSSTTDFSSPYLRWLGGQVYNYNLTGSWGAGTAGVIEDGRRDENATFFVAQPPVNATVSSMGFGISAILGSNPRLQCLLNGYHVLDREYNLTETTTVEIPPYWIEWGNNTLLCYSSGGDIIINKVSLGLASLEGLKLTYGGDEWRFSSVNLLSNTTGPARIDIDVRDFGVGRYPTFLSFDSALRRIPSSFVYPIISFNTTVRANFTNTFFIAYGYGNNLPYALSGASAGYINYTYSPVSSGSFGAGDIFRLVRSKRGLTKSGVTSGVQTAGSSTLVYGAGEGTIFKLVVWR